MEEAARVWPLYAALYKSPKVWELRDLWISWMVLCVLRNIIYRNCELIVIYSGLDPFRTRPTLRFLAVESVLSSKAPHGLRPVKITNTAWIKIIFLKYIQKRFVTLTNHMPR